MLSSFFGFIGLTGADGRLSFSKLVTVAVLALSAVTGTFGLGIAVAALASSFGAKTFLAFLSRHSSTASAVTTADAAKVIEAIKKRRDPKTGVEPS
jgi:hypothetical protein